MRDRRAEDPGPGKRIAQLDGSACYNAQTCFEICPERAIEMRELSEPFDVELDRSAVDEAAVAALCAKAGYPPERSICLCTDTTASEIAASVLAGAKAPEEVSLMTGARTGCVELCLQPIIDLLIAAGHGDVPKNPPNGFQWYGRSATLFERVRPDGTFPDEIVEKYQRFRLDREIADLARFMAKG
jgi:bacterioferritin-associated ferredoxin